jgi:CubicO group peptidase (beta-lactamase class C family)
MSLVRPSLFALVLSIAATASTVAADENAPKVDAVFATWDRPDSPGAAVAVVKGGAVVYAGGFGMADLEHDVPITPRTVFHVASVSKQFTAFGILLLAERGKLGLDDDIRKYVPEVPDFGVTITLRQLALHTSGLRDQWDLLQIGGWRMDDVITQAQILKMVSRQRELNFKPGAEQLYCNTGYTLLAEVVKRVGGEPFPAWMKGQVFQPLGMDHTLFYDDHERIVKDRAYSYRPARDGWKKSVLSYANAGATSLFTTASDMTRWLAHVTSEEPRVGSETTLSRWVQPGQLGGGETIPYAFGLSVDRYHGLRRIGHSGGDAGYRSYVGWFPEEGLGVVVLGNVASMNPSGLAMRVADLYLPPRDAEDESSEGEPLGTAGVGVALGIRAEDGKVVVTDLIQGSPAARSGRIKKGDRLVGIEDEKGQQVEFKDKDLGGVGRLTRGQAGTVVRLVVESGESDGRQVVELTRRPISELTALAAGGRQGYVPAAGDLAACAGKYLSPEVDTSYTLVVVDGSLIARHVRHDDVVLRPAAKDRFRGPTLGTVEFERDPQGNVTGLLVSSPRVRRLRFDRVD